MSKLYVMYLKKKSLEHVEFRFRLKKYDFLEKDIFFYFFPFFSKWGTLWFCTREISFLIFWNFQKFFLKNGFNGAYKMLKGTKSWNIKSIFYMCRHKVPPPHIVEGKCTGGKIDCTINVQSGISILAGRIFYKFTKDLQ